MKNAGGHLAVALAGIVSFAATVIIVSLASRAVGINLFSFGLWLVVPVGAMVAGAAAAHGFYYASVVTHTRPGWFMIVEVIVIAAAAMFAIYYADYATFVFEDGTPLREIASFGQFLNFSLTNVEMRTGFTLIHSGAVGDFGYLLALRDFVGFILGGIFVWAKLRAEPVCSKCDKFLEDLVQRSQYFSTKNEFVQAYDTLFKHRFHTPEFVQWLRWSPRPHDQATSVGTMQTMSLLKGCPNCGDQQIHQTVSVMNEHGEWEEAPELARAALVPTGIALQSAFGLKAS